MKRYSAIFVSCWCLLFSTACSSLLSTRSERPYTGENGKAALREVAERLDQLDQSLASFPVDQSMERVSFLLDERTFLSREKEELEVFWGPEGESRDLRRRFERGQMNFKKILASGQINDATKRDFWERFCAQWGLIAGESPARLVWDSQTSSPRLETPPSLQLSVGSEASFLIEPSDQVEPWLDPYVLLHANVDYIVQVSCPGYATEVRALTADWEGLKREHFELEPLRFVALNEKISLPMVRLNAGRFLMGADSKYEDEAPIHEVQITREFWMGATEVTQSQYEAVMGKNPSQFQGPDLPVHNVSWTDANEFCRQLTEMDRIKGLLPEGYVYRLPTEAEWEYACRGGTITDFAGNGTAMTWHRRNAKEGPRPVASKWPNPWGLYDMHGNCLEWCLDGHGTYPEEEQVDPLRFTYEKIKVTRGGAWTTPLSLCRSADRHSWSYALNKNDIGFRIVLAPAI